jgi:hypothetical protein
MKSPYRPDRELIKQLPETFVRAVEEQLTSWNRLFPAEQRLLEARFEWLSALSRERLDDLFASVKELEKRMTLPRGRLKRSGYSIGDVAAIARSPVYPEWREQVEKTFAVIDAGVERSGRLKTFPRLIVCVLPGGLPVQESPWTEFAGTGFTVSLDQPFGAMGGQLLRRLSDRTLPSGLEEIENVWAFEAGGGHAEPAAGATVLRWSDLAALRRAFLQRLNTISKSLESASQTLSDLRRVDLAPLVGKRTVADPRVREFIRDLLLSGNGALVFNNSFVQWGASEALRRAQPQALIAGFGIRTKPKPFSSIVWFEDQNRSNPAGDEPDPAGSLVDGAFLSRYVYLAAERLAPYHSRTLSLFAIADSNRVFIVEPRRTAFDLLAAGTHIAEEQFIRICVDWLGDRA